MLNLCLLTAFCANLTPLISANGDYVLVTTVCAAFPQGPVIVRNRIIYSGVEPKTVRWNIGGDNVRIYLPEYSELDITTRAACGFPRDDKVLMQPGSVLEEFDCVHQRMTEFNKSREIMRMECCIVEVEELNRRPRIAAKFNKTVQINVAANTRKAIEEFSEWYLSTINRSTNSSAQRFEISNWLDDIISLEFVELMLIASDRSASRDEDMHWRRRISKILNSSKDGPSRACKCIIEKGLSGARVFELWMAKRISRPHKHEVEALYESANPWCRAFAALTMSLYDHPAETAKVADNLMRGYTHEQQTIALKLITSTNSDRYNIREQAVKRLLSLGEYGEFYIRSALENSPSEESSARLSRICSIMDNRIYCDASSGVRALEFAYGSQGAALISIFAKANPKSRISIVAAASINSKNVKR